MPPSDAGFLVGADLVEFDRRDLPIYATPSSHWADAGCDTALHGASLDRLYGEPDVVHVTSLAGDLQHLASATLIAVTSDDPLVVLSGLDDGVMLPMTAAEHDRIASLDDQATGVSLHTAHHLPDTAGALCDFGAEFRSLLPLADGWFWDLDKAGWVIDHHHA